MVWQDACERRDARLIEKFVIVNPEHCDLARYLDLCVLAHCENLCRTRVPRRHHGGGLRERGEPVPERREVFTRADLPGRAENIYVRLLRGKRRLEAGERPLKRCCFWQGNCVIWQDNAEGGESDG